MGGSSLLEWVISRLGGDGSDEYDDDTVFVEFDIHYEVDKFGSDDEIPTS